MVAIDPKGIWDELNAKESGQQSEMPIPKNLILGFPYVCIKGPPAGEPIYKDLEVTPTPYSFTVTLSADNLEPMFDRKTGLFRLDSDLGRDLLKTIEETVVEGLEYENAWDTEAFNDLKSGHPSPDTPLDKNAIIEDVSPQALNELDALLDDLTKTLQKKYPELGITGLTLESAEGHNEACPTPENDYGDENAETLTAKLSNPVAVPAMALTP